MSEKTLVWYFVLPAPIVYEGPYEEGEHIVFVRHPETPMWWREVARFRDKDRADRYAQIENECYDADVVGPEEEPAPLDDLPNDMPSGIKTIADIIATARDPEPVRQELPVSAGIPDIEALPASEPSRTPKAEKPKSTTRQSAPHWTISGTTWVELAEQRLREYRTQGLSYTVIAGRLTKEIGSKFTSSMCSSKADRMGIPKIPMPGGRPPKGGKKIEPQADDTPAQDAKIEETTQSGEDLDVRVAPGGTSSMVSSIDAEADSAAGTTELPSVREIMGLSQDTLAEAVIWYRGHHHTVYKIKAADELEYKIQLDGAKELISADQFIAMVNEERRKEGLALFDIAA